MLRIKLDIIKHKRIIEITRAWESRKDALLWPKRKQNLRKLLKKSQKLRKKLKKLKKLLKSNSTTLDKILLNYK